MASGDGQLTNYQYMKLAEAISGHNMETIVQGYLNIDSETISSIKQDNFYKATPSNRGMLEKWANMNMGRNQTKVSTDALMHSIMPNNRIATHHLATPPHTVQFNTIPLRSHATHTHTHTQSDRQTRTIGILPPQFRTKTRGLIFRFYFI